MRVSGDEKNGLGWTAIKLKKLKKIECDCDCSQSDNYTVFCASWRIVTLLMEFYMRSTLYIIMGYKYSLGKIIRKFKFFEGEKFTKMC